MKQAYVILMVIVSVAFLSGCGMVYQQTSEPMTSATTQKDTASFEQVVNKLDTPEDVYTWMQTNFTYKPDSTYADEFRAPEETFALRGGDCDDYALFANYVLKQHGYNTTVVSVFTTDKGHTVCVWKDAQGKLNYLSNSGYCPLAAAELKQVAKDVYANWKVYSVYPSQQGIIRSAAE